MKSEATKKSKLWLWLIIGVVVLALLGAGAIAAILMLGGNDGPAVQTGGRPELYWNLDKERYPQDPETYLSTREAEADGLYYIRFAYNGDVVEYSTADKKLVNQIDRMKVMGLQVEDGTIVNVIDPIDFASEVGQALYIRSTEGNMVIANASIAMNGMTHRLEITELTEIYNVSDWSDKNAGAKIDASVLQPMDCVAAFGNLDGELTHVFLYDQPAESKVYWRTERLYDSNTRKTTREPDANGVYSVEFFCDGETVTLKTKDESIVTLIDRKTRFVCHYGFTFDEEGYIATMEMSNLGIRGLLGCETYDITAIEGTTVTATNLTAVTGTANATFTTTVDEACPIYDVSLAAMSEDRLGKPVDSLQLGDRVVIWTDTDGKAILVYVMNRIVDVPAYFSQTRMYDAEKKETTRKPNGAGWYEIELLADGATEFKTYKTKDKALMTYLDSFGVRCVGLEVDGNKILRVYSPEAIFGFSSMITNRFVVNASLPFIDVVPYGLPNKTTSGIVDANCKIINASGVGTVGKETELKVGDLIYTYRQPTGEICRIYVVRRTMGLGQLYWNLDRQWDKEAEKSTRVKSASGYYEFEVAYKGKIKTVKTKSWKLANELDSYSPGAVGLILNGSTITDVYDPINTAGGARAAHTYTVKSVKGGEAICTNEKTDYTLVLAKDCVYYNCSAAHYDHKGEKTTGLKVGDMITAYTDLAGEAKVVFIYGRDVDKMYWNTSRMYSVSTGETTRLPDADGYYVYELAVDGKVQTFKTKKKEVANEIDKQTAGFGLLLKNGLICSVTGPDRVKGVKEKGAVGWDVIKVSGKTMTLQYTTPGSEEYTGKTKKITIASKGVVYDVSPTAEVFGAKANVKVGDRVCVYLDDNGKALYTFITYHSTHPSEAPCAHCGGKTVHWEPWAGVTGFAAKGGHYYLNADVEKFAVSIIGSDTEQGDVVLDLNGKTLTTTGKRAFTVYKNDKLTILDSVGGGTIAATGEDGANGGVLFASGGGQIRLLSGTVKLLESNATIRYGGAVYVTGLESAFIMEGGILEGGKALRGGNIYSDASVILKNATVKNGYATQRGGNLFVLSGDCTVTDSQITGGVAGTDDAMGYGGNITTYGGKLTVTGTTVSGGTAKAGHGGNLWLYQDTKAALGSGTVITGGSAKNGGNIYMLRGGEDPNFLVPTLNITDDALITGGTAEQGSGNLFVGGGTVLNLAGGVIDGDAVLRSGAVTTVSGAPVVNVGASYGLFITSGTKLTLGQLTDGAAIYVNANGTFTEANDQAQTYLDQEYFISADAMELSVVDNALVAAIPEEKCPHCGLAMSQITWTPWKATITDSGHYYLDKLANRTVRYAPEGEDMVLDLRGLNFTTTNARGFQISKNFTIIDTVGGGTITAGSDSTALNGGVYSVLAGATLNLYGGNHVVVGSKSGSKGSLAYVVAGGTLNISGDAVLDASAVTNGSGTVGAIHTSGTVVMDGGKLIGASAGSGGSIYVNGGSLEIRGGEIFGGQAANYGGNIFALTAATVTISGGEITGGVAGKSGADVFISENGGVTISGAPTIGQLHLGGGAILTCGEMTEGASVTVMATNDGAISQKNDNLQIYLDATYFLAGNPEKLLEVVDGVLYQKAK